MTRPCSPPSLPVQIGRARRLFRERFGRDVHRVAVAPGRVNVIGEHTDYNDGFVLPMAIDRVAVVVAAPSPSSTSRLWAIDLDETFEVELREPLTPSPTHPWANHLLGVIDGFLRLGAELEGLDLAVTSTIPAGAGLASSAAIEVALATLLEQAAGRSLPTMEKVRLCQRAEHAFAGTPCGIMDMFVSLEGRAGHLLLLDCRTGAAEPIPMDEDATILIADTGLEHRLATSGYAERRASCEAAADALGVASLRDVDETTLRRHPLPPPLDRRAMHVVRENARTLEAARAFREGRLEHAGALMFESHDSLRDLYEVSCPELDTIVDAARRLRGRGVLGARMTGAGFGGCAIALCETRAAADISGRLQREHESAHGGVIPIFAARPAGGATVLAVSNDPPRPS